MKTLKSRLENLRNDAFTAIVVGLNSKHGEALSDPSFDISGELPSEVKSNSLCLFSMLDTSRYEHYYLVKISKSGYDVYLHFKGDWRGEPHIINMRDLTINDLLLVADFLSIPI